MPLFKRCLGSVSSVSSVSRISGGSSESSVISVISVNSCSSLCGSVTSISESILLINVQIWVCWRWKINVGRSLERATGIQCKSIQRSSAEIQNAQIQIQGNMKCKKYKYSSHQGKYKMLQIQIQQPSGEIRNATNTNTTIIRGNTKCNKYKYKQSSGEIQLLAFNQVVVGKTKFYSFVHTHLNVSVEIKSTFLQVIPNKSPSYFAVIIASEAWFWCFREFSAPQQ